MNPYVFIVGASRSGTTLLRRMADAHPDIAITRETHWIVGALRGEGAVCAGAPVTPELLSRLLADERFTRMGIDEAELERLVAGDRPVSYAQFVTAAFDQHGASEGKRLVGDKVPGYVTELPTLHDLWPQARFVHMIRDGRDVCLSVLDWQREGREVTRFSAWPEDPVCVTALWWERRVRLGREAGATMAPELYHELRYEALVHDPANVCEALCAFLGVPFDECMLRFHEGRERDDPSLSAKKAWRPVTAGLRDWRTEMSEEDLERFEAAAGELLDELGYARAVPDPGAAATERAARVRDSFVRDSRERGSRLPLRWRR
ncbi:MAG: sulfotransferase family protein [Thermoleophilaceae bacterium]